MIRILYITSSTSDYLADSLFHGIRSLLGANVVDYPKADIMYETCNSENLNKLHGKGFTCYGLLNDIEIDRYNIFEKVKKNYFDLIIFSSIHRQFGFYYQYYPWLNYKNTIIIDGEDTPTLFKYNGNYFRHFYFNLLPKAHSRFLYFKREWSIETLEYLYFKLLPKSVIKKLKYPKNLRKISFSIPLNKIFNTQPIKNKTFANHIVDDEVRDKVLGSSSSYLFTNEDDYYKDLRVSKYAITTKRAGWDCIRHYEIAANWCVPCFKNLDQKPYESAPYGLNRTNCIIYSNYEDLIKQINNIDEIKYKILQENIVKWVNTMSTIEVAKSFLNEIDSFK
jgi:hypothetical protein